MVGLLEICEDGGGDGGDETARFREGRHGGEWEVFDDKV